jgi:GNAT superfamily N-acetyltransferase
MIKTELAEDYKCGYASCKLIPFTEDGMSEHQQNKIRWVTDLTTDEKYRGKGLASNLLKQLGKEADQAQISLLIECRGTEETTDEKRLEAFYKRNGFVVVQESPKLMLRIPVPPLLFEQLAKKKTSQIITNIYR